MGNCFHETVPDLWAEDRDLSICCAVVAEFQHKHTDLLLFRNNKIFNIRLILITQVEAEFSDIVVH